jgi:predicted ABC-type ATPase
VERPRLYGIAGPNGSGKSTFAADLLAEFDPPLPFVNVDDIAREPSPRDVGAAAAEAGRIALRRMTALLEAGASFALETTLSGRFQIGLAEPAKERGWRVFLTFIFLRSPQLNIERVALRVHAGGHFVPDADVIRRHARSLENLWSLIHLCDHWSIFENSGLRARLVAAGSATGTVIHDDATYRWLEGFRSTGKGRA